MNIIGMVYQPCNNIYMLEAHRRPQGLLGNHHLDQYDNFVIFYL